MKHRNDHITVSKANNPLTEPYFATKKAYAKTVPKTDFTNISFELFFQTSYNHHILTLTSH
ncbi:hypothetical protein M3215_21620 [Bacillus cytotoxicus]|uniref:Uncharacterized protein n=1 Tax=Bacillus cytotoxicus TaxID=580165 RepID=A0ACC6ADH8_9BACI|nr:hypothetical protein [Bacillus cytotoxicus]